MFQKVSLQAEKNVFYFYKNINQFFFIINKTDSTNSDENLSPMLNYS